MDSPGAVRLTPSEQLFTSCLCFGLFTEAKKSDSVSVISAETSVYPCDEAYFT